MNTQKTYAVSYLYNSGAIECDPEYIYQDCDEKARASAQFRAYQRNATIFGLHERTGIATNGRPLVRPVDFD